MRLIKKNILIKQHMKYTSKICDAEVHKAMLPIQAILIWIQIRLFTMMPLRIRILLYEVLKVSYILLVHHCCPC